MENSNSSIKSKLRRHFKNMRSSPEAALYNARADKAITQHLTALTEFLSCEVLLTYVSTGDEVNTHDIINHALSIGKTVAVPLTFVAEGKLEFYKISSLNELRSGCLGILEPDDDPNKLVTDTSQALCLVPALSFDKNGHRIGYGGGYYDKYLKSFNAVTAGLCRSMQLYDADIPAEPHDVQVNMIITENGVMRLKTEKGQ